MQVSDPNNIKIYNLSAGKSLPEWLSERKRRSLLKKNVDIRRRIELIQDFDMPALSTSIRICNDNQYILATGIYKPRVKCFDVNNLSLKFERCFDSEVVSFEILSDDYSKLVFLQCDRYVEFHAAHGRYYRLRIPRFGRDMKYLYSNCDLFIVGDGPDIYRLNLERGQFLAPFHSDASAINKCAVNPVYQLLVCGTQEGRMDAWDPRMKNKISTLDIAIHCFNESTSKQYENFPAISALNFENGFVLGTGTTTGQVLLYDIRSNKPFYIKDHMYGLPIKDIKFHSTQDLIFSMDSSIVKIWNKYNGKLYTSIEANANFNNLCTVSNTGMFFIANENTKILTYYVPSLGPAPKWASFLDSLTEELEESNIENVYDDYKFVTKQELENLGLDHLLGTKLLRAYMHGYFVDIRLYKKAKSVVEPFAFNEYRKRKIREKIEEERAHRVQINKLPKVNSEFAQRLINDKQIIHEKPNKNSAQNILIDERFQALFNNTDFQIDKTADEYKLLNPVINRLDKNLLKKHRKQISIKNKEKTEELDGKNSSEESSSDIDRNDDDDNDNISSSDNEDQMWIKEMKKQYKLINEEKREREKTELRDENINKIKQNNNKNVYKYVKLNNDSNHSFTGIKQKNDKISFEKRLKNEDDPIKFLSGIGNREMIFTPQKAKCNQIKHNINNVHLEERKKVIRPITSIKRHLKP